MRRFLPVLIALALTGIVPARGANACNPYDGVLAASVDGVIFDNPHFIWNRATFPIQVFSIANPAPWGPNFICLRYELENVGSATISLIYWELIDEQAAFDLRPAERLARVKRRLSATKDAVRGSTVIKAFRSEEIATTAWQTAEEWQKGIKKAENTETNRYLRFDRPHVLDPTLARAVAEKQIPDEVIAVVDPGDDPSQTPPSLSDMFLGPFGEITTRSSIYIAGPAGDFKRQSYGVSSSIIIQRRAGVTIEAYAPGLVALDSLRGSGSAVDYLGLLKASRKSISRLSEKGDYRASTIAGHVQSIYAVEQPITVKWTSSKSSGSVCIKAAVYLPFPIPVGRDYCEK